MTMAGLFYSHAIFQKSSTEFGRRPWVAMYSLSLFNPCIKGKQRQILFMNKVKESSQIPSGTNWGQVSDEVADEFLYHGCPILLFADLYRITIGWGELLHPICIQSLSRTRFEMTPKTDQMSSLQRSEVIYNLKVLAKFKFWQKGTRK